MEKDRETDRKDKRWREKRWSEREREREKVIPREED